MSQFIRSLAITFCMAAFTCCTVAAQTTSPAPKIAFINGYDFEDSKIGVTKLVNVLDKLEAEFKVKQNELTALQKKAEELEKEAKTLSGQAASRKYEEAEKMYNSLKQRAQSLQDEFQGRRQKETSPIYTKMGTALVQWSKQNGYNVVVDVSKDQNGMFFIIDPAIVNITTANFIKYYNALP